MPKVNIDDATMEKLDDLIRSALKVFDDVDWQEWAKQWLSREECHSGSALLAAVKAATTAELAEEPSAKARARAAFAVADAAARVLVYPENSRETLAWCDAKVSEHLADIP